MSWLTVTGGDSWCWGSKIRWASPTFVSSCSCSSGGDSIGTSTCWELRHGSDSACAGPVIEEDIGVVVEKDTDATGAMAAVIEAIVEEVEVADGSVNAEDRVGPTALVEKANWGSECCSCWIVTCNCWSRSSLGCLDIGISVVGSGVPLFLVDAAAS